MKFLIFISSILSIGASFKRFHPSPKSHFLHGVFRPVDTEIDIQIHHNNSLFSELDGVFCQIGSNPSHIGTRDAGYHWFDGDGMIHATFFENNSIYYTNHWIETKRRLTEKKWGKKMYLYFGELHGLHGIIEIIRWMICQYLALIPGSKGTANTAIMEWNQSVFALHEGDMPYEISLHHSNHSITTLSQWLHPKMRSVTAHPKIDTKRNKIYLYGYNNYDFLEGKFFFNEFDSKMNLLCQANHTLINNGMIHDIIHTTNYLIIPDMPLKYDLNQILRDKLPLVFDKNGTTRFGVIHKDRPENIDWYHSIDENFFIFHFCKARETLQGFQSYACTMDYIDMMDFVHLKNSEFKIRGDLRLRKLVFHKNTKKIKLQKNRFIENLSKYGAPSQYNLDFPIEDPHGNFIYCSIFDATNGRIVGIMKAHTFNFSRRKPHVFLLKNRFMNSEPQLVSIRNKYFLLCFTYGEHEIKDTCVSLMDVENGNIENIPIPTRIPPGFHSFYKKNK